MLTTVVMMLATLGADPNNVPPEGFRALFNGKDLTGWHGWAIHSVSPAKLAAMSEEERAKTLAAHDADAKAHWSVENGELVNDGHGAYLCSNESFGSMELHIDYKTVAKADSGIYLRTMPQVQIWDSTKEGGKWNIGADKGSGGLFNNTKAGKHPLVLADKPFGEWNRFRIRMLGDNVTVWLNDQMVVDNAPLENFWDKGAALPATGPILLQTHGGEIRWKNIFVKTLD